MDYNRNSFDRFGDDLCQLILSYLPLNDCFRYECVSQQWKRLIFDKQNKLEIKKYNTGDQYCIKNLVVSDDDNEIIISKTQFQHVISKCRFISDLRFATNVFDLNDDIMDTISNNCQHLKSFKCYADIDEVTKRGLDLFGAKCGQKLEILVIECDYYQLKLLVNAMPNVKIIHFIAMTVDLWNWDELSISSLFITSDNKPVLPKLEEIDLSDLFELNGFESFVDMYCKQIKILNANLSQLSHSIARDVSINNLLTQLNRFENLEKLNLDFNNFNINESIESGIRLIGEKCTKLIELRIKRLDNRLLNCFDNNFVLLRKLEIKNYAHNEDNDLRIARCFKSCAQLTHLTLRITCFVDQKFADIDAYLPKLKYLSIGCNYQAISDTTLRSIAKMKQLCCLKLRDLFSALFVHNRITDAGVCDVIRNCMRINTIELMIKTNVTLQSLYAFMERAKQFPKVKYTFWICEPRDWLIDAKLIDEIISNKMEIRVYARNNSIPLISIN